MNSKTAIKTIRFTKLKWLLVLVLFVLGLVANYCFPTLPLPIRVAAWIVLAIILCLIALQTRQGKQFWSFAKEARNEMRRVVWPNRQETVQTTIIVFLMVIVLAVILWGVDSLLLWLISWFTGSGS